MFAFDFMRHAAEGCLIVSVLAGAVGWFLVLRGQTFAAHSLTHIGFSGAAGAVWLGLSPLFGMGVFSLLAGLMMGVDTGADGRSISRDGTTGLILTASLGLGTLFLHLSSGASSLAATLLFGNVLGLDSTTIRILLCVLALCLTVLGLMSRPLLLASLNPEIAAGRGLSLRGLSLGMMAIAALACAACAEIAGALLAFSLLVGPAATALRLGLAPLVGLIVSVLLAVLLSLGGLVLSWETDAPISFWIGAGGLGAYVLAGQWRGLRKWGFSGSVLECVVHTGQDPVNQEHEGNERDV